MSVQIIKTLMIMADLFEREISEEAAALLVSDLSEYPEDRVLHALTRCRKELSRFPTVSDIVDRIAPEERPETKAVLIAHSIVEAVSKDGWTNPDRAKERMGEEAWRVVSMAGGWNTVCETLTDRNKPTLIAQWRDLAAAVLAGKRESSPTPRLAGPGGSASLGEILNKSLSHLGKGVSTNENYKEKDGEEENRQDQEDDDQA